ncbi:MAG: insulinase family protein, partial [Acidobacteriota bacterium]
IKIVGNGGLNLIPESDRQLFPMMLRNMENGYADISDNNTFELERSYGIHYSEKIDHYGFLIEMQGNQKNFKEICQILNLRLTSANEMPGEVFQMSFNRMKRLLNTEQDVEYKNYSGQLDLSRIKSGLDTSNVAESASRFAAYRNKIVNKLNNGVIYISGDIPENFEDYITKYIATIPESGNKLSLIEKDFDILANGLVRKQFEWKRGVSVVGYLFTQIPEKITLKEHLIMEGISQFANIRMLQILREKHGLVYSTGINPYTRSYPHNFMSLSIRYMIDSTNIDTSIAIMNEVLGNMSNGIISQNELDRLKAIIQTIYITSYYDDGTINDSWLNMINNFDKAFSRTELLETIESISLKDIQVVMHEILDMENHYILIRRPKWE